MQHQSTPTAQRHARSLRSTMTDSERRLWSGLRREQLGVKFRRQHPVGNYIADFACLEPQVIVELDGSQHQLNAAYDHERDAYLRSVGFVVLRFSTSEPLTNMAGVLTVIQEELKTLRERAAAAAPTPTLPQRGRESAPTPTLPQRGRESAPTPTLPQRGREKY